MRRPKGKQQYTWLPEIVVKGHKLQPCLDSMGVFSVELDDGDVVNANSMSELRDALAEKLEQAKKQARPEVPCWVFRHNELVPATYIGKRKGDHNNYSSCYMFRIGPIGKERRENYSRDTIRNSVLKPDLNRTRLQQLQKALADADAALDAFVAANKFDPTHGDKP